MHPAVKVGPVTEARPLQPLHLWFGRCSFPLVFYLHQLVTDVLLQVLHHLDLLRKISLRWSLAHFLRHHRLPHHRRPVLLSVVCILHPSGRLVALIKTVTAFFF